MDSDRRELFLGIDLGTSYVHSAVLDGQGRLVHVERPILHLANVLDVINWVMKGIEERQIGRIVGMGFTGSLGRVMADAIPGVFYRYDTVAIPYGAAMLDRRVRFVIHLGAKDLYFFDLDWLDGRPIIREWRTGSKCGGGSGLLVEKQCRRLFGTVMEEEPRDMDGRSLHLWRAGLMDRLLALACEDAQRASDPAEFLARCGVVIQSDMIHKQNEGVGRPDILAGLFRTIARNYKVDVIGPRDLSVDLGSGVALGTGGLMANPIILEYLGQLLGVEIVRPEHFHSVAAIGVAALAREDGARLVPGPDQMADAFARARGKRPAAPALSCALSHVNEVTGELAVDVPAGTEVVIGIDGGSTTTKAALVEYPSGRLLDKIYIKTHGDPEGALKTVLRHISRHKDRVVVKGIGATGSARRLYEKILLSASKAKDMASRGIVQADRITDEITCHALGVRHFDPRTDTIFEIGGQDMKFTSFGPDGAVQEAKMNYSCQAGSGQTLENMAQIIGLKVETTLQEAALRAQSVPVIDSTCGVFMEMDEQRLLAEGFDRDQVAAAIVRGTAASYFYKFVGGSQHVGRVCSAQGGPALGRAFLAALAQVTAARINAYPHREVFGAWGQALDVINQIEQAKARGARCGTAFRGWEVIHTTFQKTTGQCRDLFGQHSCGMRNCQLELFTIDNETIASGGYCPRGDWHSGRRKTEDYVELFHRRLEEHFRRYGLLLEDLEQRPLTRQEQAVTIGIKRSTATLGPKAIWAAALLRNLGMLPILSPVSNPHIAKLGVDYSRTEFCIARKLATGHAAILSRHPSVRYLFNPSFIEVCCPTKPDLKYCIYTESEGYVLNDVLGLDKASQLNPILHLEDRLALIHQLRVEFMRIGITLSASRIGQALELAARAEQAFREELYREGHRFLERIERQGSKGYVGLGRDYVVLDPEASSHTGRMFSHDRCLEYIPQIFLEDKFDSIRLDGIVDNEYWVESVKILRANIFVAGHPNLFGIRLMNFACGPDSLKVYQERQIQQAANKPLLVLLTDAQTNNAPFVTRTEAHERVVEQARVRPIQIQALIRDHHCDGADGRVWLIPFMGNASHVGAAGLRHFGIEAVVLPTGTQLGYELARRHIWTEVCYPLKGVVGDALGFLRQEVERLGVDAVRSRYLVMLPTTSGPCRFGKYTEMVRHLLDQEGLDGIPVVGPSSESDYLDIPFPSRMGAAQRLRFQRVLFRGIQAADLLEDAYLRFRPYATDPDQADRVRDRQLTQLICLVEAGAPMARMIEWGHRTVGTFKALPARHIGRFPLVLYIGEIYMRHHDPYTGHVVDKLERQGLEVVRDPVTEWLQYVNQTAVYQAGRHISLGWLYGDWTRIRRHVLPLVRSAIKGQYMRYVRRRLAEPFHEVLRGRHVLPEPMEMLTTLEQRHECHRSIEGESPISTAIAYYLMHGLVSPGPQTCVAGIFHVGPFTCMQEAVATAKIEAMLKEFRRHRPDVVLPVIHAFFGDSPNPNLEAEIAVFRQQCYQNRDLILGGSDTEAGIQRALAGTQTGARLE